MRQVKLDSSTQNIEFAVENGNARAPAMIFQPHISPQGQANVVALRPLKAKLPALDTGELFEGTMVNFDQPRPVYQHFSLRFRHVEAVGRPMLRVAVWVNGPKHLHQPIAA